MTKKEKGKELEVLPTENNVAIRGDMHFNKGDLASVAVAKAEREIRERIKVNTAEAKKANEELADKRESFRVLGEKALPPEINKLTSAFTKHIGPVIKKTLEAEVIHTLTYDDNENRVNRFLLTIKSSQDEQGRRDKHYETTLPEFFSDLTAKQKIVEKQIDALAAERDEANSQIIMWKSKLGDMPTFERQIKAVVVESEMKKSTAGKNMLDAMDTNFDDVMAMLG